MGRRAALSAAVAAGWILVVGAAPAGAHSVTGGDLPAPPWLLAYAGVAVVALALVGVRTLPPRPPAAARDAALAAGSADAPRPTASGPGRWLGLLAYTAAVALAFTGPDSAAGNIVPAAVLVVFWIGLPLVALAAGDVFARVNPFDPVVAALGRVVRGQAHDGQDSGGTAWTGPALLGLFTWFLLAYHRPGSPRAVGVLLLVYAALAVGGGLRWGRAWLRSGEAFGALSAAMASLRRGGGSPPPGLTALAVVWVGGTAFDAVGTTELWFDVAGAASGWESTAVHTVGLVWVTALAGGAVIATGRAATRWTGLSPAAAEAPVAVATAAIAVGWFLTHDITLLLFEGQNFVALLSDPVSRGWDLFGTIENRIDVDLVEAAWVRWAQLLALAGGHAGAVVLAHRVARASGHRRAVTVASSVAALASVAVVAAVLLLLG